MAFQLVGEIRYQFKTSIQCACLFLLNRTVLSACKTVLQRLESSKGARVLLLNSVFTYRCSVKTGAQGDLNTL